jgi:5-methylthioadenosine/S-adenosylhomocysteine deaminase
MHYDILIKDCRALLDDGHWFLKDRVSIGVVAGRIVFVGSTDDLPEYTCNQELAGIGLCAMPGLVNGHAHNGMTLFRGMADDLTLMDWLTDHIFPAEAQFVSEEMVYWCTKLACAELLLSGTTTVADAYYYMDGACRAYDESGIRAVAGHGIIDFPAPGVPDPARKIAVVDEFIERWQGQRRITPAVFAHSPYTCNAETLKDARALAARKQVPFFIHLAETKGEVDLLPVSGMSPVAYLDSLGILDEQVTLVHGVWFSQDDIELIGKRKSNVISCPRSNMQLGSGMAPVSDLLAENVSVGLGTDGAASNNSLDLFAEMDGCAKLAKVRSLDPVQGKGSEILHMATDMGAACLGLSKIGLIQEGYRADLILVDLNSPNLTPMYSPDLLVYSCRGTNVHTVIIDGELLVQAGNVLTMNVIEVMAKVQELASAVQG